jgi:drug/metabolite transporter, DME family
LRWMYASGAFNLIGFLAITKGLQLTTVVHANVLNASQVALASLAGILWFEEPITAWLAGGVGLTIAGIALVDRPLSDAELADQHA